MKDKLKNPFFYYALVPVAIAFWPLLVWGLYLPGAQQKWQLEKDHYEKSQKVIETILTIDPERLDFADAKNAAAGFDYAGSIDKVAGLCRISPGKYTLSSGIIVTSGGQKSQTARVALKGVNITRFAKFLSTMQLRWANLQCTQVKLTKVKGLPDSWNVDLSFKYYY